MSTDKSPSKTGAAKRAPAKQPQPAHFPTAHRLPKKANWAAWRGMHMVKLRDAVALSLDFEPESVSLDHGEFAHRLKVAVAHFRDRRILKLNMQESASSTQPALTRIWVPHFAAWARIKPKWHLPSEMTAIAQPRLSQSAQLNASQAQRRAVQARSWQEAVRGLADELHLRDDKAGRVASLKEIAARVAVEAARHSVHGPRGELSAQNILRAALQGGKWKRPRGERKKVR